MACIYLLFSLWSCQHSSRSFAMHHKKLASQVCAQSNEARLQYGLHTLKKDALLDKVAQDYANILQQGTFFDHIHPNDSRKKTPLNRVLYFGGTSSSTAENLASIPIFDIPVRKTTLFVIDREKNLYSTTPNGTPVAIHTENSAAKSIVESWLNSPGHRENLLHRDLYRVGCGTSIIKKKSSVPMIIAVQVIQGH